MSTCIDVFDAPLDESVSWRQNVMIQTCMFLHQNTRMENVVTRRGKRASKSWVVSLIKSSVVVWTKLFTMSHPCLSMLRSTHCSGTITTIGHTICHCTSISPCSQSYISLDIIKQRTNANANANKSGIICRSLIRSSIPNSIESPTT